MKQLFKERVRDKVKYQRHLLPIFSSVHNIPERVYEYDKSFFVVYNTKIQKYEIHSLDYPEGNTISLTIPFDELDIRTIEHLYKNDIRIHGKEIFRRLEQSEELARKRAEREQRNTIQALASETQSMFAKDAWLGGT